SVRFDTPSKAPSPAVVSALSNVPVQAMEQGKTFASPASHLDRQQGTGGSPWAQLREEFYAARKLPLVSAFWGVNFLDRAEAVVEKAAEERKLGHAVDGQPIAAVLASALVV